MTQILCRPMELITRNVSQRLDVVIRDQAGQDVDPSFLEVTVQDASETVRHRDGYPSFTLTGRVAIDSASTTLTGTNTLFLTELRVGDILTIGTESSSVASIVSNTSATLATPRTTSISNAVATKATRIQRTGIGRYYIEWGASAAASNIITQSETNQSSDLAVHWRASAPGEETVSAIQLARIISVRTQMWIPFIRTIVDKAKKNVSDDPENPCFLGYTDAMLVQFLEDGLSWINAFQPYPMWSHIDHFPEIHRRVLFDAALMAAITSQEIFAVDTDLNYCFVEGTKVIMADGTTKVIEEVEVGDQVLDRNGTPQAVEAAWCEGSPDELVEIKLWGGHKFEVTKNHEWPVWSWPRNCMCGCGKPVKQGKAFALGHHTRVPDAQLVHVRGGKNAPTGQSLPQGYDPIKRLASEDLVAGDFLLMPRKWEEVETDVSVDEALMLGYYAAEGHPLYRNADPEQDYRNLCWTFCKDEEGTWVEDIKRFAEAQGFEIRTRHDPNAHAIYVSTKNDYGRSEAVLRLASLAQKHIGAGSTAKRLSDELMRWPRAHKVAFITGLLRGDGHQSWSLQTKDGSSANSFGVWYSSSSRALIGQVQLLLSQLGYPSSFVVEEAREAYFHGRPFVKGESYKLKVPAGFAHELADIVWGEMSIANQHKRTARDGWSPPRPECMVDDDFIYIPIKRVQIKSNDDKRRVFNLTVANDHSYLVGNIATFNSDQGNAFVIEHQPKLSGIANATWQRLTQTVPLMKRHYVRSGAVRVEAGPSFRFASLLYAAPPGSVFRNWFSS